MRHHIKRNDLAISGLLILVTLDALRMAGVI